MGIISKFAHIFIQEKEIYGSKLYLDRIFRPDFCFCSFESIVNGDIDIWSRVMSSSFDSAKTAFELSLGLTGVLSLWMGIMKIGEKGELFLSSDVW